MRSRLHVVVAVRSRCGAVQPPHRRQWSSQKSHITQPMPGRNTYAGAALPDCAAVCGCGGEAGTRGLCLGRKKAARRAGRPRNPDHRIRSPPRTLPRRPAGAGSFQCCVWWSALPGSRGASGDGGLPLREDQNLEPRAFGKRAKFWIFSRPRMGGRGPREVGMAAVCGAGGSKRSVAGHRGVHGSTEEVGGAAGLDGMASGFFAPKGLQQISPGQSGPAIAAERRPGEDVVFNRLP